MILSGIFKKIKEFVDIYEDNLIQEKKLIKLLENHELHQLEYQHFNIEQLINDCIRWGK